MVYFHSSISVCNSVDQSTVMPGTANSAETCVKSRQNNSNHVHRNRKVPNSPNSAKNPDCNGCRSAVIDVVILIAVISACGFLVFPSIKIMLIKFIELAVVIMYLVKAEVYQSPVLYGSICVTICFAAIVSWGVLLCLTRKCGNPDCKGLRKAAEFDIQLETEECVKSSNSSTRDGVKKGLFELPRDHHRELEAELKKMAPPNGRAVLVFRARCGCSIGRLEVPGPRKHRKIKK